MPTQPTYLASEAESHRRLEANRETAPELLVGFGKKGCGKASVDRREASEDERLFPKHEAACIDGEKRPARQAMTPLHWITRAKKTETRAKRPAEHVDDNAQGRGLSQYQGQKKR